MTEPTLEQAMALLKRLANAKCSDMDELFKDIDALLKAYAERVQVGDGQLDRIEDEKNDH